MAGIAFDIQKLLKKKSVSSVLSAFFYSGIVSSGHWLFAVFSLAVISTVGVSIIGVERINLFRGIVIYAFAFSMIIANGSQVVLTRQLADVIYKKREDKIPAMLVSSIFFFGLLATILYLPLILYLDLNIGEKIQSLLMFCLVSSMGTAMIFVSTLKDYKHITISFLVGFTIAIPGSLIIGRFYDLEGFLFGINIGVSFILFLLSGKVLVEYRGEVKIDRSIITTHRRYPVLFFYGFISALGIWIDKLILWYYRQETVGAGLYSFPLYDSAMFIAYFTVLPSLAYFILILETGLYLNMRKYSHFLNNHGILKALDLSKTKTNQTLKRGFYWLGIFQGTITLFCIIFSPLIIEFFHLDPLQISMLRIGMLASFFQMGTMLIQIVMAYYNFQREMLLVSIIYLLINSTVTFLTRENFWLYGYGYFLASFISMNLSISILRFKLSNLHYYMVCTPQAQAG